MAQVDNRRAMIERLMAANRAEAEFLSAALADVDRNPEPGSGGGTVVQEREIDPTELSACIEAGNAAQKACHEAGGSIESCYAVGRAAESACLETILKAPKSVKTT